MKKVVLFAIIILSFALIATTVMAEGKGSESGKSSFVEWLRGVFHYPVNVSDKTANVVADSTKKAADTTAKTVNTTTDVITGDVQNADKIIMTPAQGAADVIVDTTKGVVNAPIDAAKEGCAK